MFFKKKYRKIWWKVHKCVHLQPLKHRGVEQLVARQAHNLEVARSNPASATIETILRDGFFISSMMSMG